MRRTHRLQVFGVLSFLAGTGAILAALAVGSDWMIAVGTSVIVASLLCLAWAALSIWRNVDWDRIEAEQTLWESGPLGRAWLKLRRLLFPD